jgi:hypothetical protein
MLSELCTGVDLSSLKSGDADYLWAGHIFIQAVDLKWLEAEATRIAGEERKLAVQKNPEQGINISSLEKKKITRARADARAGFKGIYAKAHGKSLRIHTDWVKIPPSFGKSHRKSRGALPCELDDSSVSSDLFTTTFGRRS